MAYPKGKVEPTSDAPVGCRYSLSPVSLGYRADIDGLRAVAVLFIVLFHADIPRLAGGFVGVDIFFVISGFLITRLLALELSSTGSIDFWGFYLRRAKRILPALFFTLLVTSAAGIAIFTSQCLQSYGASLLHAVLSVSNVFFFLDRGYFAGSSKLMPLLHTWSLGVEEQFYLIWPFLIYFTAHSNKKTPLALAILAAASLAASQAFLGTRQSAVFYLMPFRIFEFALGALLVWAGDIKPRSQLIANGIFSLGLALLFLPLFRYSEMTPFPGLSALVPCLGAALCIHSGDRAKLAWVVRNNISVGIGLISYSLYLIHWPIIVFYRLRSDAERFTYAESACLLAAAAAAAALMYFFVERPFRRRDLKVRPFLVSALLVGLSLAYLGASFWGAGGWAWRRWVPSIFSADIIKAGKQKRFQIRKTICEKKTWAKCDLPEGSAPHALILGDSHAPDALNALQAVFPDHDFSLSTLGGCPPHPNIESITPPTHPDRAKCASLNKERYNSDYLKQFDYIVINVLLGWYSAEDLGEYLKFLHTSGVRKVIVLGGYFSLRQDLPELINRYGFDAGRIKNFIDFKADKDAILKKYTEKLDYYFLSKREVFCPSGACQFFDETLTPFTYDAHHLSLEFAQKIARDKKESLAKFLDLGK